MAKENLGNTLREHFSIKKSHLKYEETESICLVLYIAEYALVQSIMVAENLFNYEL